MAMCKGMEEYTRKIQVETTIDVYRDLGKTDDEIINYIIEHYHVTDDYVKQLMAANSEQK